jgi:hypothetical protein
MCYGRNNTVGTAQLVQVVDAEPKVDEEFTAVGTTGQSQESGPVLGLAHRQLNDREQVGFRNKSSGNPKREVEVPSNHRGPPGEPPACGESAGERIMIEIPEPGLDVSGVCGERRIVKSLRSDERIDSGDPVPTEWGEIGDCRRSVRR